MTTASRLGLWLGAAAVVAALALAATSVPRRAAAPAVAPPVASVTAPLPDAIPVAAVPEAKPVVRAQSKPVPVAPAPAKPTAAPVAATESATPAMSSGLWIGIDPETGLIGTTVDATIGSESNFSDEGLTVVKMDDGTLVMDLEGRFQMYSTVTMGPNGKTVFRCGSDPHPAHKNCAHPALPVE